MRITSNCVVTVRPVVITSRQVAPQPNSGPEASHTATTATLAPRNQGLPPSRRPGRGRLERHRLRAAAHTATAPAKQAHSASAAEHGVVEPHGPYPFHDAFPSLRR